MYDGFYENSANLNEPFYCQTFTYKGVSKSYELFLYRTDGSINYNKPFQQMKNYIGNGSTEFFSGFTKTEQLCNQTEPCEAILEFQLLENDQYHSIQMNNFYFQGETQEFRYQLSNVCSDDLTQGPLIYHRNWPLSTSDRDNDEHSSDCVAVYNAANWHRSCYSFNVFGPYVGSGTSAICYRTDGIYKRIKNVRWGVRKISQGVSLYDKLMLGKFTNINDECEKCDNLVCATCETSATNCIIPCNTNCGNLGCETDGTCLNCASNYFLDQNKECISSQIILNSNNRYQIADGTTYNTCEEYEAVLEEGQIMYDGFYENSANSNEPIYCITFSYEGVNKIYELFLLRLDGSVDFRNKSFQEMKNYISNLSTEMFSGFTRTEFLCSQSEPCEAILSFQYADTNENRSVQFNSFYFQGETEQFRFQFSDNCSENLNQMTYHYHKDVPFSTNDVRNDVYTQNCAVTFQNPNWHKSCFALNVFGAFTGTGEKPAGTSNLGHPNSSVYRYIKNIRWGIRKVSSVGLYSSIMKGKYTTSQNICEVCDNQVCATCQNSATNCIIPCDSNCGNQGCDLEGICINCPPNYHRDENQKCQSSQIVLNSNNRYQKVDGSTYSSCEEYENAIDSDQVMFDGFYENSANTNEPIYCHNFFYEGKSKVYELFLFRTDGSVNYNRSYAEMNNYMSNKSTEMFSGFGRAGQLCSQSEPCETVLEFQNLAGDQFSIQVNDVYFQGQAQGYRFQFSNTCSENLRQTTLHYHRDYPLSTIDNDQDQHSTDCANYYVTANWHRTCYTFNVLGQYDAIYTKGICYQTNGPYTSGYMRIKNVRWGVRKVSRGGLYSDIMLGKYTTDEDICKYCDNQVCATCVTSATNCIIPCNTNCGNLGCDTDATCLNCADNHYYDDNRECQACQFPCLDCTQQNICISCSRVGGIGEDCSCPAGQFADSSNSNNCSSCDSACIECETTSNNCTLCTEDSTKNANCTCKDGHFSDGNNNCLPCIYPCGNCTQDANTCTTCQITENRNDDCSCVDGYFMNSSNNCQICTYPCSHCSGTATSCTKCVDNQNRNSDCSCELGYFENGSSCQQCVYPCQSCSDLNTCNSCTNTTNRNNDCSCESNYFDNGSSCEQCNYPCQECENNADNCTECSTTQNRNANCSCESNYFDNGSSCVQCNYPCSECESNADNCTQCTNTQNRENDCSCLSNYFDNGSSCEQCNYPCSECENNADSCTACVNTNNRKNDCSCESNYFDNGSSCEQCNYPCSECENNADNCTVCSTTQNRNSDCSCESNYFDNGTSCEQCNYPCQECESNADNCTECSTTQNRFSNCSCESNYFDNGSSCEQCNYPCSECENDAGSCTVCVNTNNRNTDCLCESNYFDNGTNCQQCNYPCSECENDADSCTVCVNTQNRNSDCSCQLNYFDNQSSCEQCNYPCQECENNADNCTVCSTTQNRNNDCSCESNYFDNGSSCEQCSYPCSECENDADSCTVCVNTQNRENDCSCESNYFDNGSSCKQCNYPCSECENNADQCTVCVNTQNRESDCSCSIGYFDNGSICGSCVYPCDQCTGAVTNCTTCINTQFRNADCSCQTGYFDNGSSCEQCNYPCQECENNADSCTVCVNTQNRNSDCSCESNYFDNGSSCEQCNYPCSECENDAGSCTVCVNTENRENDCTCESNYFDNGSSCEQCNYPCSECENNADTCTECSTTQNRNSNCSCESNYFDNGSNCEQCSYPCQECNNSTNTCTQCVDNNNRNADCSCETGYFDNGSNCEQCSYPCSECSDENICTVCVDNNNRNSNCSCESNYFDNGSSCEQCNYPCQECENNANSCTVCSTIQNRNDDCSCEQGYLDNNSSCEPCAYPCSQCENDINTCTQCVDNNNRNSDCSCQSNYFDNGQNCEQCSHPCQECINSADTCTSCVNLENRENDCSCEPNYFDNGQNCEQCVYPCQNCSSLNVCLSCVNQENRNEDCSCVEGSEDNGSQCVITCEANCLSCTTDECNQCAIGYYIDQQSKQCQKCDENCDQCDGPNSCTKCSNSYKITLKKGNNCQCEDGFYYNEQHGMCNQCSFQCKTCSNKQTCNECINSFFRPPFCFFSFTSFFTVEEEDGNNDLHVCESRCKTCITNSPSQCTECVIQENRSQIVPECQCLDGYFENSNESNFYCEKCSQNCQTCIDRDSCLTCNVEKNLVLDENTLTCVCQYGFKLNPQQICQKCYTYQDDCYFQCPKNTITDEKQQSCKDIKFEKSNHILLTYIAMGTCFILVILLLAFQTKYYQKGFQKKKVVQQYQETPDIKIYKN